VLSRGVGWIAAAGLAASTTNGPYAGMPETPGLSAFEVVPTPAPTTIVAHVGTCDSLEVAFAGYDGPATVRLTSPAGTEPSPGELRTEVIEVVEGTVPSGVTRWVRLPEPGIWTVRVRGGPGLLSVIEHGGALVHLTGFVDGEPGETQRPRVMASWKGDPIPDARVTITVVDPAGTRHERSLRDDGTQDDLTAGDGTFTGRFEETSIPGDYHVEATVVADLGSARIDRRLSGTFHVASRPDAALVAGGTTLRPTPEPGVYQIETVITNLGSGTVVDCAVYLLDGATALDIRRVSIEEIAPGDTVVVKEPWTPTIPLRGADDSLRVSIELWPGAVDRRYDNNHATASCARRDP